jgi:KaiC/GvpD/RAD55 family RecA-like ATPase
MKDTTSTVVGSMGNGKTLLLVKRAQEAFDKGEPVVIASPGSGLIVVYSMAELLNTFRAYKGGSSE